MLAQFLRLSVWPNRGVVARVLWPLAAVYSALAALNRWLYLSGLRPRASVPVPVIVVGNVVAGGAGKTPVVMAVVRHLQDSGLRVAVVSRGHGRKTHGVLAVADDSSAQDVGDEPLLLHHTTGVPVYVASRRADAARAALSQRPAPQVIVCDDGLQHWALVRDVDICVFDARGVGNGWCLPAGPLREPWPRPVDMVVTSGGQPIEGTVPAHVSRRLLDSHARRSDGTRLQLAELAKRPVHAVAGIAQPEAFFTLLTQAGVTPASTEALPDHFDFSGWLRRSGSEVALVCTEKDAVKLWAQHPDAWAVPLVVDLPPAFFSQLDALIAPKLSSAHGHTTA